MQVRMEKQAGGELLARKAVDGAGEVDALLHEARLLEVARHPGVVSLVGLDGDGAESALLTRWVGNHTLTTFPCRSPQHAAGLIAALATTVADLHEGEITHGRIDASHVLIDRDGLPVLCGFSGASAPGHPGPAGRVGDNTASGDTRRSSPDGKAEDVAALGRLLHELLGSEADMEPIPPRRLRPLADHRSRSTRRALRTLADHATADEPRRRPTARALAAAISEAVPDAVLTIAPPSAAPTPEAEITGRDLYDLSDLERLRASAPEPPPRRTSPGWILVPAAAALVAMLLLAAPWRGDGAGHVPELLPHGAAEAPAIDGSAQVCRAGGGGAPHSSGDLCAEPFMVEGNLVRAGDRAWRIGELGDDLQVGDWDCDGAATAALLRPSTGELFLFEAWADPGAEIDVRPTLVLEGASSLRSSPLPGGCEHLEIELEDGSTVPVPTEEMR